MCVVERVVSFLFILPDVEKQVGSNGGYHGYTIRLCRKVIVKLREESAALDADDRLRDPSAARRRLPEAAANLRQDLSALTGQLRAGDAASAALREHIVGVLRATEATLHSFQRSYQWREAARLAPGAPPPPQLLELLNRAVVLPNPFLSSTMDDCVAQLAALGRALGALKSALPEGNSLAVAHPGASPIQSLNETLREQQEVLLATAARVQAATDALAGKKAAFLSARREAGKYEDPFEGGPRLEKGLGQAHQTNQLQNVAVATAQWKA